jgi:hypothetical protein
MGKKDGNGKLIIRNNGKTNKNNNPLEQQAYEGKWE